MKEKLYNWAVSEKNDIRGNLLIFLLIPFIAIFVIVNIRFPDLFFAIEHGRFVDGGTPSDRYRAGQMFGRVAGCIAIVVLAVLTFTIHN